MHALRPAIHASTYLRAAARLEFQTEELYLALGRVFAHAPLAQATFLRLAFEERQHALRFQLIERLKIPLPWTPEVTEYMRSKIDDMAGEVAAFTADVSDPRASPDPYLLLRKVADMEDRFSFLHAEHATPATDPRLREVLASMARQDAEHTRLLQRMTVTRVATSARATGT